MATYQGLVDHRGRPIEKPVLTQEVAAAQIGSARSPLTGYPGDGLTPPRLAQILRQADMGDPIRYLELAETVEERDPHYVGVLATRRRSVSQLEVTVTEAGKDKLQLEQAQRVRDWLQRDELQAELFDMLDAIGKGYSFIEIMWDTSGGQWEPRDLCWRDPRWFAFDRGDMSTPLLRDDAGQLVPLPPGKFIAPVMRAKSGLPVRSGIARVALWGWMFKAFTNRDWQSFAQNYGQPVRVGKYTPGASEADKNTLFRAVANIAGDCAAIIPSTMEIEFIESANVGAGSSLYLQRVDHLDQQMSKLVLGQTATTDAIAGGHAVGKEHRQVQEDIERADAKELARFVNRDLVKIWIDLEYGPPADGKYPRVLIGRPDEKDIALTVESVGSLIPYGLEVGQQQMRDLIGLGVPDAGDKLLVAKTPTLPPPGAGGAGLMLPKPTIPPGATDTLNAEHTDTGEAEADREQQAIEALAAEESALVAPAMDAVLDFIADIVAHAKSLEEVRSRIIAAVPDIPTAKLASALRQAQTVARLTGRGALADG